MFPNYQLAPNRNMDAPGSRTGFSTHLSQFSLDPKIFGMRKVRAQGLVRDAAFLPNPTQYDSPESLGGPNLLYSAGLYSEDSLAKAKEDHENIQKMIGMSKKP